MALHFDKLIYNKYVITNIEVCKLKWDKTACTPIRKLLIEMAFRCVQLLLLKISKMQTCVLHLDVTETIDQTIIMVCLPLVLDEHFLSPMTNAISLDTGHCLVIINLLHKICSVFKNVCHLSVINQDFKWILIILCF